MYLERTSSAKGPNHPPPFRPFSAVVPMEDTNRQKYRVKRRAASASTVTFKMQLQFNLSKPVLSAHFQAKDNNNNHLNRTPNVSYPRHQQMMGASGKPRVSSSKTSPGSTRSPGDLPMSVSFHQSRESMMSRRSKRSNEKTVVGVVEKASVQQCEQNKKLFEDAVVRAESTLSLNHSGTLSPTFTGDFSFSQPKSPSYQKSSLPSTYSNNNSNLSLLPSLNDSSSYSQGDRSIPHYARPSNCSIRSKTNGPTIIGSPIYNNRGSLPVEERSNAGSSPPVKTYNHERYKTAPPVIRRHMERVSSAYKVVTPWHDSSSPPTHHILKNPAHRDHIYLIPHDEDYTFGFEHDYPNGILSSTLLDEPPNQKMQSWAEGDQVLDNEEDQLDGVINGYMNGNNISPRLVDENGVFLDDERGGLPLDSDEPSAPVEINQEYGSTEQEVVVKGAEVKNQINIARPSNEKEKASEDRDKEEGVGSDDSSSLPSKPSSAKYWQRQTWVDDATVTSSKKSDEEPVADEIVPEKATTAPAAGKTALNSPKKSNAEKSKADPKSPAKGKGEIGKVAEVRIEGQAAKTQAVLPVVADGEQANAKPGADPVQVAKEKVEVLNLNDLKRRRTTLPKFICPSSETKSREAAVRDWLETTSIHWAVKTSPLL